LRAIVGTVMLRGAYRISAHDRRHHCATYDRMVGNVPGSRVGPPLEVDLLANCRPGLWAWLIEEPNLFPLAVYAHGWRGWWTWHQPPQSSDGCNVSGSPVLRESNTVPE
jgi:hypothetical protein